MVSIHSIWRFAIELQRARLRVPRALRKSVRHRHDGSSESVGSGKPKSEYRTSPVMGHVYNQGARRQDMTATETFSTLRQFWLKRYDAVEVSIMDKGTEFRCRLSTPVSI